MDADFHSRIMTNLDENEILDQMIGRIIELIANFQQNGSNWVFERVNQLQIHLADWKPFGGSFIPLPPKIKNKKAVINIKNEDNQCFKWCIATALDFVRPHPERITADLVEFSKNFNWDGLTFPVDLKQIMNIFGFDDVLYPFRISEMQKRINIDLLLISEEEKQHYCLINSLSRLVTKQLTKHCGVLKLCQRCLNHFPNAEKLKIHKEYCSNNETVKIDMPKAGSQLSFIHQNRAEKIPFIVYADFEAFTKNILTCTPNQKKSFTKQYQYHQPSGFCFKIVCFDSQFDQEIVLYRAQNDEEDIGKIFIQKLEESIKKMHKIFDFAKKMLLTKQDEINFQKAKVCWICQKEFGQDKKVRDHSHFTGEYRGAAHVKCNLHFKKPKFTPVVFHNLSGYDSHLFVKNLGKSEGNIKCLPNNDEKHMSFFKEIVVREY